MNEFERMFNFLKKHWIITVLVLVFIIPVLINLSYNLPIQLLITDWDATDVLMFYGSVLTFCGTMSLGVFTIYQNHQIKLENDKSQQRLERINQEANEVNTLNIIINIEQKKLYEIKEYLDIFTELHSHRKVYELMENLDRSKPLSAQTKMLRDYNRDLINVRLQIDTMLEQDVISERQLINELKLTVSELNILITNKVEKFISKFQDSTTSEVENEELEEIFLANYGEDIDEWSKLSKQLFSYKEKYIADKMCQINKLMYGGQSLSNLKSTYAINSKEDTNESQRSESKTKNK